MTEKVPVTITEVSKELSLTEGFDRYNVSFEAPNGTRGFLVIKTREGHDVGNGLREALELLLNFGDDDAVRPTPH